MKISVLVRNQEQLDAVSKYPCDMIYTDNFDLIQKNTQLYYQVPRVYKDPIIHENMLVSDIGLIYKNQNKNLVSDYFMNVANSKTIQTLLDLGVKKVNFSLELENSLLKQISNLENLPVELLIYGYAEDMLLKKHPIFTKNGYAIEDYEGRKYPISVNESGVHIYHFEPLNRIDQIPLFQEMGIQYFRLDFYQETSLEIEKIMTRLFKK